MKRTLALLALVPLLSATAPAPAQQAATGQSCARIDDEAKRLLCYDLVFRTGVPGVDPSAPPPEKTASLDSQIVEGWPLTTSPSPNGKGLFLTITNTAPEPMPDSDQPAKLTISCAGEATSLSFWFPGRYMSTEKRILEVSYDGAKAEKYETGGYDSQMSISGAKSIPVLKQLIAANSVKVTATPTSGPKFSVEFDLSGLGQAITPLREACGW